ncbi:MAG: PorV/PorQ family protein [Candidatus Eisenbacteria bacterium]|nr:PorV/PorQ family protein [Candidatus Eisenbacteria bacterium]
MKRARLIGLLLLVTCTASPALAGNSSRLGTAGAQELRIPVSARGMALGDGIMATVSGVEAIYYNPAGMSDLDGVEAYFSHMEYLAGIDKNYVAAVTETPIGTVGLMVDVLSIGDIEETTVDEPEGTGKTFSPNFAVVGMSYSRFLTDAVSVGGTAKLISERILEESANGLAFDIGIQYRPGWQGLRFGFLLKNFGPEMQFDGDDFESFQSSSDNPEADPRVMRTQSAPFELPSVFQMGVGYTFLEDGSNRMQGFGNFVSNNFGSDQWNLGAEYSFGRTFALRAGYLASEDEGNLFSNTFSFGAGLGIPLSSSTHLQVDYGMRKVDSYFDDTQIFSAKFTF